MTTSDDQQVAELEAFAAAYRAAAAGVSYSGWHAGARTAGNRLLAYHDSGAEAEVVFRPGERPLFNIMQNGHRRPDDDRPFTVWSVTPAICGTVEPGVRRLEVISGTGAVVPADIVAHTFAVDLQLAPPPVLPDTASIDDRLDEVWGLNGQAHELARRLTARVHGDDGLLYEGSLLNLKHYNFSDD
ncbi:hypothetical protein [Kutzneria buriramensis]|uniref:hypothetical protein n=1 Tax=Kutzneria buriramensis TaxID=1045776 RepID=UPI001FE6C011|nr:hypothetical protein [Kutzneria buriramensis]